MMGNIDWLYRLDVFYCEFCEATHDATNHVDDADKDDGSDTYGGALAVTR